MGYRLGEVLYTREEIKGRIRSLALEISNHYRDEKPVMLPILTGSFIFVADLIRELDWSPQVEFIRASSYNNDTRSSGKVTISGLDTINICGKRVLIVEDIVDTALSIISVVNLLQEKNPKEIKVVTLLDKHERRKTTFKPDFVGFDIPNKFIVGYGLDYAQQYRGLPDIWSIEEVR